jgi:hypothetical protein
MTFDFDYSAWGQTKDFGVESFKKMGTKDLNWALGFTHNRSTLMVHYRIPGKDHWDSSQKCVTDKQVKGVNSPTKLLWHQQVGVAALVTRLFTDEINDPPEGKTPGVLLADEVGLGKTLQCIAFMHFYMLWTKGEIDAPLLRKSSGYFSRSGCLLYY